MRKLLAYIVLPLLAALSIFTAAPALAADTAKIVLIAGRPSHGPGAHEFNAGCKLLAKCLSQVPGIEPVVVTGGWPKDESVFEGARTLVFFMDGGSGHPMIQRDHLETIQISRQEFQEFARTARAEGIGYLGGCCGCNAAYLRAMARGLAEAAD